MLAENEDNTATHAPEPTGEEDEYVEDIHGDKRGWLEHVIATTIPFRCVQENYISNEQTQQQYDGETVAAVYDSTTSSRVLSLEKLDAEAQQKNEEDDTN